jgi:hypothetical protein
MPVVIGVVVTIVLLPFVLVFGVLGLVVMAPAESSSSSWANGAVCATSGGLPGLSAEQAGNARSIIATAAARDGSAGAVIAVMTAMTESALVNVSHGDVAGPDSLGLFQQRASWGTVAQRMDPATATGLFLSALEQVPSWSTVAAPVAAQTVQRSAFADGSNYARNLGQAQLLVSTVLADAAAAGCVPGGFSNVGGAPVVSDVAGLNARAQGFADASAAGRPDPFFGGTSYYRLCGELAARINGHPMSGWSSAAVQWSAYVASGEAHAGDTSPPTGALLFYSTSSPAGHVATYLGGGKVASNDVGDGASGRSGGVYIVSATALTSGPWRLHYLGWAAPRY